MSKRSAGLERVRRTVKEVGPITRKQQVEALRAMKSEEMGHSVARQVSGQMKELVDEAVEAKFKSVLDTVLSLIDRVADLESVCYENGESPSPDEIPSKASPLEAMRYHCIQCGYIGKEPNHDDCPMMAAPLITQSEVEELERLRSKYEAARLRHKTCKPQ